MFISKLSFPMSTMQLAVSMKGQPRIRGISVSSSMSIITKSIRKVDCFNFTRTSSTTPQGRVIKWFASCSVILIGTTFKFPSLLHIERGIKLMLAPRSMKVFPTEVVLVDHGIVALPGSLNFCGRSCQIIVLQFPSTTMLLLSMYFLFFIKISFMIFVYIGIYCNASPKGMMISNFLKISRKRAKYLSLSFVEGIKGYRISSLLDLLSSLTLETRRVLETHSLT